MKKLHLLPVMTILLFVNVCFIVPGDTEKYFTDRYIKSVMKKVVSWQLDHPKHNLYSWTNAAFYSGVYATYETTNSKKIYQALLSMGEQNDWKPGPRLFHADDHAICQIYVDLYRIEKDDNYICACVDKIDSIITLPYPVSGIQKITWWWCDALFMAPPALVKFGVTLNEKKYLDFNDKLFRECYDLLFDKDEHLFARDLKYVWTSSPDDRKEKNGQKIFWSRGNGWVMAGLARILQELSSDYPNRPFYEDLFVEMANRIVELQQSDGLWRVSLLDPDSYPGGEASGSGFYCYALAWGLNNGLLKDEKFLNAVRKAWIGLNGLVNEDGMLGWVQPIGGSPEKNYSENSWEVYGTGAFLLAGSEIIKMKE